MMNEKLLIINLDGLSKQQQTKLFKNISEGYNQNIYMCPDKKNLTRFKKTYIKSLSKQIKYKEHHTMAYLLLDLFKTEDYYYYIDYDDDKYKHNNYYECYQFSENDLIKLHNEGSLPNKDVLIDIKKKVNQINKQNVVCFGNSWRIACHLEDKKN